MGTYLYYVTYWILIIYYHSIITTNKYLDLLNLRNVSIYYSAKFGVKISWYLKKFLQRNFVIFRYKYIFKVALKF